MERRNGAASLLILVLLAGISGCSLAPSDSPRGSNTAARESSHGVPDTVGARLDHAREVLEDAGYVVRTKDLRGNRSVWETSNWVVVSQEADGKKVTLTIEKYADSEEPEPSSVTEDESRETLTGQLWADRIASDLAKTYGFDSFGQITHEEGWTEYSWTSVIESFSSPVKGKLLIKTSWGTALRSYGEEAAMEVFERVGEINPDLDVIDVIDREGNIFASVPRPTFDPEAEHNWAPTA